MIFSYSIKPGIYRTVRVSSPVSAIQSVEILNSNNLHIPKESASWNSLLWHRMFFMGKVFLGKWAAQNYFCILISASSGHFLIRSQPDKATKENNKSVNCQSRVLNWNQIASDFFYWKKPRKRNVESPCKCCQATVKNCYSLVL